MSSVSVRDCAPDLFGEVDRIIDLYSASDLSVAGVLCDRHPSDLVAYRIVGSDLSADVITYGELREASERLAFAFKQRGFGPGARIATLMGKSREYLVTLLAIWRIGAVHVPLFTAFAASQIGFRLEASGAVGIVCDESQAAKLADVDFGDGSEPCTTIVNGDAGADQLSLAQLLDGEEREQSAYAGGTEHPIVQLYTSGTTGTPKGVVMPAKSLASFHAYMTLAMDIREDDVFWGAADPGWAYGLFTSIFGTMTTGVSSILLAGGFSAELTAQVLKEYGVTNFTAAPTVYRSLKSSDVPFAKGDFKLRCASAAGEPLTPDVNLWARDALGVEVHDHYGQTEMGMMVNNHHHPDLRQPLRTGSMGVSLPGFHACVLKSDIDEIAAANEVGRLAIDVSQSRLHWFAGYADAPEKTAEKFAGNGRYYLTGDTAEMDEDGFIYFSSRDDDVIIMAGYRIGPFEIESTLSKHPAVVESAAVARPDEVRGEVLEAFVVIRDDHDAGEALEKELQQFVKTNFAAHAYPRKIHFASQLPKTPSGKIQRFLLREKLKTGGSE